MLAAPLMKRLSKRPLIDWTFFEVFRVFQTGLETCQDADLYIEKQRFHAFLIGFMLTFKI